MPHPAHPQPYRSHGSRCTANGAGPLLRRLAVIGVLLVTSVGTAVAAAGRYHVVATIPVGGDGWWDYLSVDSAAHRLYVSHASKVVVVDTRTDTMVGEIADTQGVHGLVVAPELGLGFTSNGRTSTSSIVDLKTLVTVGVVHTGENPDAIVYVPGRQEVYTFNHSGRSATVFAAKTGKIGARADTLSTFLVDSWGSR